MFTEPISFLLPPVSCHSMRFLHYRKEEEEHHSHRCGFWWASSRTIPGWSKGFGASFNSSIILSAVSGKNPSGAHITLRFVKETRRWLAKADLWLNTSARLRQLVIISNLIFSTNSSIKGKYALNGKGLFGAMEQARGILACTSIISSRRVVVQMIRGRSLIAHPRGVLRSAQVLITEATSVTESNSQLTF